LGDQLAASPQQSREGSGLRADEDITLAGFFARGCLILVITSTVIDGMRPESQVRTRLAAGGRWIRTIGTA
jgi:hypothetical protein